MIRKRLLNDSVALYHKKGENADGKALYETYILKNIRFENRDSVYASNRGLKPYDGFKLYFVMGKSSATNGNEVALSYISPITWENLLAESKESYWTAAENDIVTLSAEIPEGTVDIDEMKRNQEMYYINSVIPCRTFGEIKLLEITGRGRSVDSD
ncbi:MAG: hypothetical protein E7481_03880 [Ruminococcaceae bacterium]|nr:hypothetical protein [Oscillospiraceae bacterium]